MSRRALFSALCLCASGAVAAVAARQGHVVQATRARAYLDAGRVEGLSEGQEVELRRAGAPAGRCRIEALGDHRATCTGAAARAGDAFALPDAAEQTVVPALRAPVRSAAERAQETSEVQSAALAPVEFHGAVFAPGLSAQPRMEAVLTHATWAADGAGPWNQERLDVNARGVPLGAGLALYVDASARRWLRQGDNPRFRPNTATQLYVWEAQVSARTERSFLFSLGRINPWNAPGASRFDGAQVGYRSESGNEIGLYGGGLPDPSTLAPEIDRGTAGMFWSLQHRASPGSALTFFLQQGRVSLVATPEGGTRFEGEATAQGTLWRALDLAGDVRAGAGGTSANGLEAARLDLSLRPVSRISLSGGFRYIGIALPDFASTGAAVGGPSRDGDFALNWQVIDLLQLSAAGGGSRDLTSGLSREWLGPDLSMPSLFGAHGGLSLGYREERGWLAGRSAFLQATTLPLTWLRLLARASWTQDERADIGSDQTFAFFASAQAQLGEHIELRLELLTQADPFSLSRMGVPAGASGFLKAGIGGIF